MTKQRTKNYRIDLTPREAELILSYIPADTVENLRARDKFYKVALDLIESGRYELTLHSIIKVIR